MPTSMDESFLDDMNNSYMIETIMGQYGAAIDFCVESAKERVGLFESKEEAKWRENLGKEYHEDPELIDLMGDDDMIDSIIDI